MTAKDLIELLQKYPSDSEVCAFCADIGIATEVTDIDFDSGETCVSKTGGNVYTHPSIVLHTAVFL